MVDLADNLDPATRRRRLKVIFFLLAVITLIINLDGGGVPAALINIQYTYQLEAWQLGLLGALVYAGQATGSVACGPLLKKHSPTRVCQAALLLNTIATFTFAASTSAGMLLVARFAIGLLQAAPAVYFPVWVDEFGPEQFRTVWMSAIQAGAPLGIMCGYVLAGLLTQDETDTFGWRVPFYLQSGVLLVFTLFSPLLPKPLFDLQPAAKPSNAPGSTAANAVHPERFPGLQPSPPPSPPGTPDAEADDEHDEQPPVLDKRASLTPRGRHRRTESGEGLIASVEKLKPAEAVEGGVTLTAGDGRARHVATSIAEEHTPSPSPHTSPGRRGSSGQALDEEEPSDLLAAVSGLLTRTPFGTHIEQNTATGRERLNSSEIILDSLSARADDDDGADGPGRGRSRSFGGSPARAASGASADQSGDLSATGSGAPAKLMSTKKAAKKLLHNPTYMFTCFALAALFFVVTGIQFWVTSYLVDVLGAPKDRVVASFAIVSITAPILGVAIGAAFVDKLGGYEGPTGIARTLKICAVFATIASMAALSTCFVPPSESAFVSVVSLISVTLFFGGGVIPSATGVLLEVAPPEARQVASAGSMFCFQTFGYALSPLVSAIVMEIGAGGGSHGTASHNTTSNATGELLLPIGAVNASAAPGSDGVHITPFQLTLGFRTVMAWGLLGAILLILAWRSAAKSLASAPELSRSSSTLPINPSIPISPVPAKA